LRLNILIFTFDRLAVQVAAMTEKKIAIKLTAETDSGTEAADPKRCIRPQSQQRALKMTAGESTRQHQSGKTLSAND